jgi:predicted TPR repeat methyltransferase
MTLNKMKNFAFLVGPDGQERKILFHDYAEIYSIQGLYEQLFYERLKCSSPTRVTEALKYSVSQVREHFTELRVLDLGAGNGMMGEKLRKHGISRKEERR